MKKLLCDFIFSWCAIILLAMAVIVSVTGCGSEIATIPAEYVVSTNLNDVFTTTTLTCPEGRQAREVTLFYWENGKPRELRMVCR